MTWKVDEMVLDEYGTHLPIPMGQYHFFCTKSANFGLMRTIVGQTQVVSSPTRLVSSDFKPPTWSLPKMQAQLQLWLWTETCFPK
jgi:hypothetical protein